MDHLVIHPKSPDLQNNLPKSVSRKPGHSMTAIVNVRRASLHNLMFCEAGRRGTSLIRPPRWATSAWPAKEAWRKDDERGKD